MVSRLYRGDVILVFSPDGKGGLKRRPVIVYKDFHKDDKIISIYCTTQNNANDESNIFVPFDSHLGFEMMIESDTYIRTDCILHIPVASFIKKVGTCSIMNDIQKLIDKNIY